MFCMCNIKKQCLLFMSLGIGCLSVIKIRGIIGVSIYSYTGVPWNYRLLSYRIEVSESLDNADKFECITLINQYS